MPGAMGGANTATAGAGGSVNIIDNRPGGTQPPAAVHVGFGGNASLVGGIGGAGYMDCVVGSIQSGGAGGPGGPASGSAGVAGTGPPSPFNGQPGSISFFTAANGGRGGDGVPAGDGGPPGSDATVTLGEREVFTSFMVGGPGLPCDYDFDLTVDVLSDLNGHDCCTGATSVNMLPMMIFADGFESGDTSAWSSITGSVGSPVPLTGAATTAGAMATATFSGTGSGTVAGVADVSQTLDGVFRLDTNGRILSFTATLVLDSDNNKLPAGGGGVRYPVSYTLTETLPGS